ncbi:hypothetical protein NZ47_05425 [Anaerovibrio lipolyticus]|uniref:Uncharacterized protein n=1 Tax=Anaerovibrio lipolyticus TaxID=82374 RepID=A0A0B2JVI7_9FIRM|nr:hypothetical protein [Anaerovibrio lipolyticus]KHM52340.1 hypothetical protein NZ47_05425 [Anaerovibrio lipolyticus]
MVFQSPGRNLYLTSFLYKKKGCDGMENTAEKGIEQLCITNIIRIAVLVIAIIPDSFPEAVKEMLRMVALYWGIGTIVAVVKSMWAKNRYGHTAIISSILLGIAIVVGGVYFFQPDILCQFVRDFVVALFLALSEVLAPDILSKFKTK